MEPKPLTREECERARDKGATNWLVGRILRADPADALMIMDVARNDPDPTKSYPPLVRCAAIDWLCRRASDSLGVLRLLIDLDRWDENEAVVGVLYQNVISLPRESRRYFEDNHPRRTSGVAVAQLDSGGRVPEELLEGAWRSLALSSSSRSARWLASLGQ